MGGMGSLTKFFEQAILSRSFAVIDACFAMSEYARPHPNPLPLERENEPARQCNLRRTEQSQRFGCRFVYFAWFAVNFPSDSSRQIGAEEFVADFEDALAVIEGFVGGDGLGPGLMDDAGGRGIELELFAGGWRRAKAWLASSAGGDEDPW